MVAQREKFQRAALTDSWDQLVTTAATASREQAPLLIRDLSVNCAALISNISTASGCSVSRQREEAIEFMDHIKGVLGRAYGLQGDRSQFMFDVASVLAQRQESRQDPTVFRSRSYEEVVALVAQPLQGTSFVEDYNGFAAVAKAWNASHNEMAEVKKKISFWDWVNFFSDTPEEHRRDEISAEIKGMKGDFQARSTNGLTRRSTNTPLPGSTTPPTQ
jgi:hypothetical protein